ncbi:MAG: hypothetical protein Q7S18_01200, partial [bacterium]|nr:hypothetical protein [bacterium]
LYIGYEASFIKNVNSTVDELGKLETVFKNAKSEKDFLNIMNSEKKIIEDAIANHKKLIPPPGLEEVQQKEVGYYEKLLALTNNLISNFEAKSVQGVTSAAKDIDDFYADKKIFSEIDQLQTYYFGKLHDGFVKSREKADNIKMELIKSGTELNVEVKDINIAGW